MEDDQSAGVDTAEEHLSDWLQRSFSVFPEKFYQEEPYTMFHDDAWLWDVAETHTPATFLDTISGDAHSPKKYEATGMEPSTAKEERFRGKKKARTKNGGGSNISGSGGGGGGGGGNKEARWAEKLLNPCASAIAAGNLSRAQHLLYVLDELASFSGDANHRLAAHGLQALSCHVPPLISIASAAPPPAPTFATANLKLFHDSLLRFNESSPWFSFPNTVANAAILQTLAAADSGKPSPALHIVDIGVSHGVQWPTLLESLTRRPAGKPPVVTLTVVPSDHPIPFSVAPPGHDFAKFLLHFAEKLHLNLQIHHRPAETLITDSPFGGGGGNDDETVVVCAQFRLHSLPHRCDEFGEEDDDRTTFLRRVAKTVSPDLMVLSEYDGECGCAGGDFAAGFARRVEFVRRFLDSASAAFKGRESEERRVVEGEAAAALSAGAAGMREGRERWCRRMVAAGFAAVRFSDEAVDGGRALLRKHDGGWEMKVEGGPISLSWKGQPILFVSLWRPIKQSL